MLFYTFLQWPKVTSISLHLCGTSSIVCEELQVLRKLYEETLGLLPDSIDLAVLIVQTELQTLLKTSAIACVSAISIGIC